MTAVPLIRDLFPSYAESTMLKRIYFSFCFLVLLVFTSLAQQIPSYTQSSNYYIAYNPAFTGIKKNINVLLDYRNQWDGFEGAPVTQSFMLDSRFLKGKLGAAGSIVSDETGPYKRVNYTLNAAYHIHFSDVELSFGASGSENKTFWDSRLVSVHNSGDPAVDHNLVDYKWIPNTSFGLLVYNDRFHFGVSAVNLLEDHATYFKNDPGHTAKVTMEPNYYFNVGYNYAANPDYIWENNVVCMYAKAAPINIEYNLKLNLKKKVFVGTDIRLGDAIALQAGVIIMSQIQIGYSYDFVTFPISRYQQGTNEITIVYKSNIQPENRYRHSNEFQHQKYFLF
jgi:type IX secretion system PorP/SprF family membrane protein